MSAARLAIVPEGANSASSLPVSSRASRLEFLDRRVVPAGGVAEARHATAAVISGVGGVTVSLRKSWRLVFPSPETRWQRC